MASREVWLDVPTLRQMHMRRVLVVIAAGACFGAGVHAEPAAAAPRERACRNGYVSISYDDGPTATTPALLKALRRADLQATFFNVGEHARDYPEYVVAELLAGHQIANHSYTHADLTTLSADGIRDELRTTDRLLNKLTGGRVSRFMRPPYGAINDTVRDVADRLDLTPVIWTADTNDWAGLDTQTIVDSALAVQSGGFVLMHDGYENTIAAVPLIAAGLEKRGLCAGRIVSSRAPVTAWEGLTFKAGVAAF